MPSLLRTVALLLLFMLSPRCDETTDFQTTDTVDIFLVLEQLGRNETLLSSLANGADENSTSKSRSNLLERYARTKSDILYNALEALHLGLLGDSFNPDHYNETKTQLGYKIDANRNLGYQLAVTRDEVTLAQLELRQHIHSFLRQMRSLLLQPDEKAFDTLLHEEYRWLDAHPLQPYRDTLSGAPESTITESLRDGITTLGKLQRSYREMLDFLQRHRTKLLSENPVLELLRVQTLLQRLDAVVPYRFGTIGFGKIILIFSILLVFFSLRRFIVRWMIRGLERYFIRHGSVYVHARFAKAIQRPVSFFLMLYAIGLSLEVLTYPDAPGARLSEWLSIFYVILIAWAVIKLVSVYGEYLLSTLIRGSDNLRKEVINMLVKMTYFMIVFVVFFVIFRILNFNVSAIIASLGIGGLAVALAAKDTLSNFFASVMILLDNSFSQGDWIECEGIEGIVVEIGLRKTTVRTFDNAMLFVPNAKLAENSIRNWSRRKVGRRIKMHITLTYDSPRLQLRRCVEEIRTMLIEHEGITAPGKQENISEPLNAYGFRSEFISHDDLEGYKRTFLVFLDQMNSSSVDILVYCFTRTTDWEEWLRIKEDVIYRIMEIVERNGLKFAFPSQSIYVESLPSQPGAQHLDA